MDTEELNESELGTQEYWDNCYKTQIKYFRSHGDVGDCWFGGDIMDRVIRWLYKTESITNSSRIIDLGCGNGIFLIELARDGYENLIGVDYSADAIVLSKEIAEKEDAKITYQVFDILDMNTELDKYDVVHDKGTYDAISLSSNAKENRQTYINRVYSLLEDNGFFVITSCNWTQSELVVHFKSKFSLHCVIPTPQFNYCGQTGNIVSCVVFQKIL